MAGSKQDVDQFSRRWTNRGGKTQDAQVYWVDFFQNVLGLEDALDRSCFEVPICTDSNFAHASCVNVLLSSASTLADQRSVRIDLDKNEYQYIINCYFSMFRVYDRESYYLLLNDIQSKFEAIHQKRNTSTRTIALNKCHKKQGSAIFLDASFSELMPDAA